MYPINKPVTPADIRTRAAELLAREDEWTPWERIVLAEVRDEAEAVHAHYMRHAWFEIPGLGIPDAKAARDEVLTAVDRLMTRLAPEHACESLVHSSDPVEVDGIDAMGASSLLLVHALLVTDALVESLRRGPCAVDGGCAYGMEISGWNDLLSHADASSRSPVAEMALSRLDEGLDGLRRTGDHSTIQDALRTKNHRYERQFDRNDERLRTAVRLSNENYAIPDQYHLRVSEPIGNTLKLLWGEEPLDDAGGGLHEVRTRPSGGDVVPLQINALYELHPRVISDIARAGRFAAMCLGRDAEIRATGHELTDPPAWTWVGPIPLVHHLRNHLQAGNEIQVGTQGITEGPFFYARRLDIGGGTYAYSPRTLDESLTLDQPISADLAYACVGNPVGAVVTHPLFDDERIVIEACETSADDTDLDINSPIIRLMDAPEGIEQDPEEAWLSRLRDFDDVAVYGERLYRR